ncbi:MAG: hypothetical protein R2867_00170 [Caldilineaceae bacterium]
MNVEYDELLQFLVPALIAVVVVLVARVTTVYGLGTILRWVKRDVGNHTPNVLRGVVCRQSVGFSAEHPDCCRLSAVSSPAMSFGAVLYAVTRQ